MSQPRIVQTVRSCSECPNYRYYSGGTYQCVKVNQDVREPAVIAAFCPLPHYPSQTIADQAETIRVLRLPNDVGFWSVCLEYVATKLSLTLRAQDHAILLPCQGDRVVTLRVSGIIKIDTQCNPRIFFIDEGNNYTLSVGFDRTNTVLHVEVPDPRSGEDDTFFENCHIQLS